MLFEWLKRYLSTAASHTVVWAVTLIIGLGAVGTPVFAQVEWEFVDGERPATVGKAEATAHTSRLKRDYRRSLIPLEIILDPVTEAEKATLGGRKDQPLQIGLGRDIPSPYREDLQPLLTWTPLASGALTAAFTVTSPGARALRLALAAAHIPDGAEVRFFSVAYPEQIFGPFTATDMFRPGEKPAAGHAKPDEQTVLFWSPVLEGDTVGVEIYLPSPDDQYSLSLAIPQLSHLVHSVLDPDEKALDDIGDSDRCNIDVACRATEPAGLKNAVAKIIFTERGGSSSFCTGNLLNDKEPDSAIPYFLTAHHCLSTQSVANTINSYWFFERVRCGGPPPRSVVQFTRGGELLATATEANTDFTFLQLNDTAITALPEIWLAGWDNAPIMPPSLSIGIHHPQGDLKKWSGGNATGFAPRFRPVDGRGSYIRVVWSQGTTEGGSSGSGLFDTNGRLVGTLSGGEAFCGNQAAPDWYGRFDLSYPAIRRWLAVEPVRLASKMPVSDAVAQGKWQEYKIMASAAYARLVVRLDALAANADLYVRRGSRPNLNPTGHNCRPSLTGTSTETCTLRNSGDNVYYIGVYGVKDTAFTLKATLSGAGDSVGLYDPAAGRFDLKNVLIEGVADIRFRYGPAGTAGWLSLAGDWNGDGLDTVGLYRPATGVFFLRNDLSGGVADIRFRYGPAGAAGWLPLAGDWNGDGLDTVGLYDPATGVFFLRNDLSGGVADIRFRYGPAGARSIPITGNWDGL